MLKKLFCALLILACAFTTHAQTGNYFGVNSTGDNGSEGAGDNRSTGDYNVGLGDSALFTLTSGLYNTALGYRAGYSHTTTSDNIYIGYQAGYSNTTGADNVFIGKNAGFNNNYTDNTFIGTESGYWNSTGSDNTFIGEQAGYYNTDGDYLTFIGEDAGYNNTTGDDNTFIGRTAGRTNTTGFRNTFVGNEAGYDNNTGSRNTCIGDSAGTDIGVGSSNTMIGQGAGACTEHTSGNTFVGAYAGWDNNRNNGTDQSYGNTALGYHAGYTNRAGYGNVVIGYLADFYDSESVSGTPSDNLNNVCIGREAAIGNGSGGANGSITLGAYARTNYDYSISLGYSTYNRGQRSTAIGYNLDVADGNDDVNAIGYSATPSADGATILGNYGNVTGLYGVAIGYTTTADSMAVAIGPNTVASGTQTIAIGDAASATGDNSMAIGPGVSVAANNEIFMGNTSVASIGGVVNWTATSDGRFKTNIQENVPGLNFINQLRPVTYNFDMDKLTDFNGQSLINTEKASTQYTGFIAQEVEAAAHQMGFDFSGIKVPNNPDTEMYGVRYAEFVVPLVKATQELSQLVQTQENEIQALKAELQQKEVQTAQLQSDLESRIQALENAIMSTSNLNNSKK